MTSTNLIQQCGNHLLPRPPSLWLQNAWWWDLERHIIVDIEGTAVYQLKELLLAQQSVTFGQQYTADNVILNQTTNGLSVGWYNVLMIEKVMQHELVLIIITTMMMLLLLLFMSYLIISKHNRSNLGTRQLCLRKMHIHFVSVEIGVERLAVGIVQTQHLLVTQYPNSETHHRGFVQRWLTVHDDKVAVALRRRSKHARSLTNANCNVEQHAGRITVLCIPNGDTPSC
jgi:hypothetical protein